MGLCKCQRKKVTNLFCFEHRVNVCEYCLISEHPRCIVKSYLQWLKDSDYSSLCAICSKELISSENDDFVRLMCLDIFHWKCLDEFALAMPPNTAPAGYECPLCAQAIIPLSNRGGPLAEALRTKLSKAAWMTSNFQSKQTGTRVKKTRPTLETGQRFEFEDGKILDRSIDVFAEKFLRGDDDFDVSKPNIDAPIELVPCREAESSSKSLLSKPSGNENTLNLSTCIGIPAVELPEESCRSLNVHSLTTSSMRLVCDDDDKYKRRVPSRSFTNLFPNVTGCDVLNLRRHRLRWILFLVVFVLILLLFVSHFGGQGSDEDELLNPLLNPDIHVDAGMAFEDSRIKDVLSNSLHERHHQPPEV